MMAQVLFDCDNISLDILVLNEGNSWILLHVHSYVI